MSVLPPTPWTLEAHWPVFAGHFPSQPVLPGALLLDWVVDAIAQQLGGPVAGVPQVKFSRAAQPGDQLLLSLRPDGLRVRFDVVCTSAATPHTVASGVATLQAATASQP